MMFAVLIAMAAAGHTDAEMAAVMAGPVGDHVRDQAKPEKYLARQITKARDAATDPDVKELNKTYATAVAGARPVIIVEAPGEPVELWPVETLHHMLRGRFVMHGDKKVALAKHWLENPLRRQYRGIEFAPEGARQGYYNLWRGLVVKPKRGDCSKFLAHIHDNVCCGDADLFDWVVGWFAHMVQRPAERIGTALILKGEQGTGKTIVGNIVGSLFGPHYQVVDASRYLTGNFNGHLAACMLLQAEEAFFAGDKAAEGRLKNMVTSETHLIERKGAEPIELRNYVRLFVTSNSDWVVPAGAHERRFAVLEVSSARMQDNDYFGAIVTEMKNGGREALLDHLLNFDLTKVNLRRIPQTAALLEQKLNHYPALRSGGSAY